MDIKKLIFCLIFINPPLNKKYLLIYSQDLEGVFGFPIVGVLKSTSLRPTWIWSQNPEKKGTGIFRINLNKTGWLITSSRSFTPITDLTLGYNKLEVQERDFFGKWSNSGYNEIYTYNQIPLTTSIFKGHLIRNGNRLKLNTVYYVPDSVYSIPNTDGVKFYSDNLTENSGAIILAYDRCNITRLHSTSLTDLQILDTLSLSQRHCLWLNYDNEMERKRRFLTSELKHIKELGFNSINTGVNNNLYYNPIKFLPSRPESNKIIDRSILKDHSCDGTRSQLRTIKDAGLIVSALAFTSTSNHNETCNPMAFMPYQDPNWTAFQPQGEGCVEAIKNCQFDNPDIRDSFISYDLAWEPVFLMKRDDPKIHNYNWFYHHFPEGKVSTNGYRTPNSVLNYRFKMDDSNTYRIYTQESNSIFPPYYLYLSKKWKSWLESNYGSIEEVKNYFEIMSLDWQYALTDRIGRAHV